MGILINSEDPDENMRYVIRVCTVCLEKNRSLKKGIQYLFGKLLPMTPQYNILYKTHPDFLVYSRSTIDLGNS